MSSCESFLEEKPEANLTTPQNLMDLRSLLDDESIINRSFPGLMEMGTDDYYLDYTDWASRPAYEKSIYCWQPVAMTTTDNVSTFWTNPYRVISTANIVLESLERLGLSATEEGQKLAGEAYFIRGYMHFSLAQIYAMDEDTDSGPMGIPIRRSSDIDIKTVRSSVAETYNTILEDLETATRLLPESTDYLTRADRTAAFAALSRIYLFRGDYDSALRYAEKVLEKRNILLDYNSIDVNSKNPFPVKSNPEILYFGISSSASSLLAVTRSNVDSLLYRSFENDDLRKQAFFTKKREKVFTFKGFYSGAEVSFFYGLALDEVYLNKAECLVRLQKVNEGLSVLNKLLENRYKQGSFVHYTDLGYLDALKIILTERRKEMCRRGVRWSDLRRLNADFEFRKKLKRSIVQANGSAEEFVLDPDSKSSVFFIPDEVISRTGIVQNPQ
ncbi:hypothetical protein KO02_01535 [Sphingobacterium sp. ML3W]|uniref:RagB/SusD family nutrient uptake outer membrane protein n=1 Tax=Sphingobacterium sp. ML3W TaxID=1538644 RepID=UPI0004F696D5|nr:RagB/SusD family nutrient uptake outer membrane protein [Sphingobacterium sp. ML3W]AIM35487.1 hypothetical protein KO02_01535 [Sphingobacterium sp. ML3W]